MLRPGPVLGYGISEMDQLRTFKIRLILLVRQEFLMFLSIQLMAAAVVTRIFLYTVRMLYTMVKPILIMKRSFALLIQLISMTAQLMQFPGCGISEMELLQLSKIQHIFTLTRVLTPSV